MIKGMGELERFVKELGDAGKKQLPFAISKSLNATAKIAQQDVANHIADTFEVSNGWYLPNRRYGVKKKSATKQKTSVTIYMDRPGGSKEHWIEDHNSGDSRSMQLVPTKYFMRMYGGKNAAIKRKAKSLLSNRSRNRIFDAKIGSKTYIFQGGIMGNVAKRKDVKSRRKVRGFRRRRVTNRAAVPLFLVANTVHEKPVLRFEQTVENSFEKNFAQKFYNDFNWAMFTAK